MCAWVQWIALAQWITIIWEGPERPLLFTIRSFSPSRHCLWMDGIRKEPSLTSHPIEFIFLPNGTGNGVNEKTNNQFFGITLFHVTVKDRQGGMSLLLGWPRKHHCPSDAYMIGYSHLCTNQPLELECLTLDCPPHPQVSEIKAQWGKFSSTLW